MKQMYKFSQLLIAFAAGGTLMASACSKDETKAEQATKPVTEASPKAVPTPKTVPTTKAATAEDKSFAAGMMKSYEACRTLLAADKVEGIAECAKGIVDATKSAHAPEAAHRHIGTLATAAEALAKMPTEDIEAVRLSFGEVSKSTVAMLTAAPDTAKNYHVFECPMAKGYKRWAQPGAKLENPYMGAKMLACGSEVHDHHKAMKAEGESEQAPADHEAHKHEH